MIPFSSKRSNLSLIALVSAVPPSVLGFWVIVISCNSTFIDLITEVELMKERFAKLLLGEDMSGGGKGVCTALAISNAITNLSGLLIF